MKKQSPRFQAPFSFFFFSSSSSPPFSFAAWVFFCFLFRTHKVRAHRSEEREENFLTDGGNLSTFLVRNSVFSFSRQHSYFSSFFPSVGTEH